MASPLVSIIMGSASDHETMRGCEAIFERFGIAFEVTIVSAHRTPRRMFEHAERAASRGVKVIIAGAGGAAHLPGMVSALTTLPVLGVPIKSKALKGLDSLLSIVQMPAGVPTATFAIGEAGATNAALFAVRILAVHDEKLGHALQEYKKSLEQEVLTGAKTIERR